MKNCLKILASVLVTGVVLFGGHTVDAATRTFTDSQQRNADYIAEVVSNNWDEYGVLPSVAIAQAFMESNLGDHCPPNNLWGIHAGRVSYPTLEHGIYKYMEVINNGYYEGAPGKTCYYEQLQIILDGGYCIPVGNYYKDAIWIIENYDLYEYDRQMFEAIEAEEKAAEEAAKKEAMKREKKQAKKKKRESTVQVTEAVKLVSVSNAQSLIDDEMREMSLLFMEPTFTQYMKIHQQWLGV